MSSVNDSVLTMLPRDQFAIEHAVIRFRNFSGAPDRFSKSGYNNGFFKVFLTEEQAQVLSDDGYSVKRLKPNPDDPEDPGQPLIKIRVGLSNFPENVFRVTSHSQIMLNSDTVKGLDHSEIENADIVCVPYNWTTNTGSGKSAYLGRGSYFTMVESPFENKYSSYDEMMGD